MTRRPTRRQLGRLALWTTAGAIPLAGATALESRHDVQHTRLALQHFTSERMTGRELRVVQLTDVHDLPRAAQRASVISLVAAQRPDLVAITGDLVNTYTDDLSRMRGFVAELVGLGAPVFYVPGNHEHANAHFDQILAMVASAGAEVVHGRVVAHDGPWGHLDIIGTDDYYSGNGNLLPTIVKARPGSYRLVLTHSPQVFTDLQQADADLAICGHTHGGQVRIPGVGALYAPGGGLLPHLDKGCYQAGRAVLYIDSGVGQSVPPLRLFDQSQITLITITHP